MPLLERYSSTYTREANQKAFQKSTLYILYCSVLNNSPQSLLIVHLNAVFTGFCFSSIAFAFFLS